MCHEGNKHPYPPRVNFVGCDFFLGALASRTGLPLKFLRINNNNRLGFSRTNPISEIELRTSSGKSERIRNTGFSDLQAATCLLE